MYSRSLVLWLIAFLSLFQSAFTLVISLEEPVQLLPRATSRTSTSKTASSTSTTHTTSFKSTSASSSTKLSSSSSTIVTVASTIPGSSKTSSSSSSTKVADSSCTNGPFTRSCWGNGFSIATDYDNSWPVTGKTIPYNLEITNTTMAPDGFERLVMAINGQIPGPTLYANWGDTLQVTVKNSLTNNGTSMHWHGIRQWNSNNEDGTNGITECPIAPGESRTYTFLLTQFGTTWYHSHYSSQYGDGVVGSIVIAGPATSNYDIDLGAMPITDWYYKTAFQCALQAAAGGPPTADTGLINGTMVSASGGRYNTIQLVKGKKYRLRLINTGVDNHFKFSLDNHNLTVIQADFVPVVPYVADWIFLGIGERYDVIITADQDVGNYWFRAEVQTGCGSNANNGNIKAIFSYSGAAAGNPTTTATPYTQSCDDETGLTPYVVKDVPSGQFSSQVSALNIGLTLPTSSNITTNGQNVVQWTVNGSMLKVDWDTPTLKYVLDGNTSYPTDLNLIQLPNANAWSFWIIQSTGTVQVPHPIHLHGHDFYLLGTGSGVFSDPAVLKYSNPMRRDVAMLPANGWLVIGFVTDNPGAWLMHCHIAWHVGEGLAVQFLEQIDAIPNTFDLGSLLPGCASWASYYNNEAVYVMDDSGL